MHQRTIKARDDMQPTILSFFVVGRGRFIFTADDIVEELRPFLDELIIPLFEKDGFTISKKSEGMLFTTIIKYIVEWKEERKEI